MLLPSLSRRARATTDNWNGYRRAITYTLASECAACVRAAGFTVDAELPERGGWDNGRPRYEKDIFGNDRTPTEAKVRWVRRLA